MYSATEIRERLQWLVKLRWAGCIGVFAAVHIVRDAAGLTFPLRPVYLILGTVALYNIYFHIKLKSADRDFSRDAVGQISLDFLALGAAIYFSGGCDSPFLYYFIFHIVISGLLLPRIWTFMFAAMAIILPTAIVGLLHLGIIPLFTVFRDEPVIYSNLPVIGSYGAVFASTILLTAYFVTYLSDRLFKEQKETKRLYTLSERLRSSIVIDEVIDIILEEMAALTGSPSLIYFHLDKKKELLVIHELPADDTREQAADSRELAIPLSDMNVFTDSLLSGEARTLTSVAVNSAYEDRVFKELMANAREITILPVMTSFTVRCSGYFHCPDDTGCPSYNSDDRRCWYIAGVMCRGKKMRTMKEKLKECVNCEMFAPVGIFAIDTTPSGKHGPAVSIEACLRLLDAAGLAVSNARLYQRTLELSEIDGLTGIRNRRSFMRILAMEMQRGRRYTKNFGLLMLDIDYFKNCNDTHGHPQGDILLKAMAEIIRKELRETDTPGRYGGEEFIMLLPETGKDEAIEIAERIRQDIEAWEFPRADRQPGGRITVSIGVASYPEDGETADKIISAADDALYAAKASGRNRVIAVNRPDMLI